MGLLNFDKPKKVRSTKEHNEMFLADCEVDGTYVPNMSQKDRRKWKGKVTGTRLGFPQVEIRKDTFVTVVALNGYNYKHYRTDSKYGSTKDLNIHVASAGPIQMTFKDWEEWRQVVEEAKKVLENLRILEKRETP